MLNQLQRTKSFFKKSFSNEKPRADILRVYEGLTGNDIKKKTGRAMLCLCCFHQESHPSLALYPDTNSFFCFSCSMGGDVIKFVMEKEQVGYRDALEILKQYDR